MRIQLPYGARSLHPPAQTRPPRVGTTTVDGFAHTYDALNRLIDANRDGSNLQDWTLDSLGNWSGATIGATSQTRTANAANEITGISGSWIDPTYDAAGNMVSGPKSGDESTRLWFVYDGWNRLVQVKADSSGQPGSTIAAYEYDGQGRRIEKITGGDTLDYFWNESYQNIEMRKNDDADPIDQTIYDIRYVDAPVVRFHDANTDGDYADGGDSTLYVTGDANFDVTATVNADGSVANRFVYTPYGQRTVLAANWTAGTTDFDLGHQGLMFDAESGLYYNRARYLHATLGTFTVRDPLGFVDGGDVYQYVRSGPLDGVDPEGLRVIYMEAETGNKQKVEGKSSIDWYQKRVTSDLDYITNKGKDKFQEALAAGRVKWNGKKFEGKYDEYIERLTREKDDSKAYESKGNRQALIADVAKQAGTNKYEWDQIVVAVHGLQLDRGNVMIQGKRYRQKETLAMVGKAITQSIKAGDSLLLSCYQDGINEEGMLQEEAFVAKKFGLNMWNGKITVNGVDGINACFFDFNPLKLQKVLRKPTE